MVSINILITERYSGSKSASSDVDNLKTRMFLYK